MSGKIFKSATAHPCTRPNSTLPRSRNARTTLEVCRELPSGAVVVGIDISESQIQTANHNLQQARAAGVVLPENITFAVADATAIGSNPETSNLDLVVSNAALHWVPLGGAYKPIYDALAHDGAIAISKGVKVAIEALRALPGGCEGNWSWR